MNTKSQIIRFRVTKLVLNEFFDPISRQWDSEWNTEEETFESLDEAFEYASNALQPEDCNIHVEVFDCTNSCWTEVLSFGLSAKGYITD